MGEEVNTSLLASFSRSTAGAAYTQRVVHKFSPLRLFPAQILLTDLMSAPIPDPT